MILFHSSYQFEHSYLVLHTLISLLTLVKSKNYKCGVLVISNFNFSFFKIYLFPIILV